jgi:hypothetical protein
VRRASNEAAVVRAAITMAQWGKELGMQGKQRAGCCAQPSQGAAGVARPHGQASGGSVSG